nr:FT-like protein [Ipomoea batatas]
MLLVCKVMVDPDAPSPSNPNLREYLHWKRGGLLREPASVDGDPPLRLRAVPPAGAGDGVRAGMASELQHPRLRRALQSQFAVTIPLAVEVDGGDRRAQIVKLGEVLSVEILTPSRSINSLICQLL